jgi:ferric-dicitrate binding protein FerR (iron transport regulator)
MDSRESRNGRRRFGALCGLAALGLTGCADGGWGSGATAIVPPAPMDPLAAFVATAPAGARGMVVLADGSRIPARVARSYVAASGRECREVMLGSGRGERASLVCQGGPEMGGSWVVVRPLLGGGMARS